MEPESTNPTTAPGEEEASGPATSSATQARPLRVRHLVGVAVATALAVAVLAVPASVWAAGHFNDVPEGHAFYNDIEWMAHNDISQGFDGGTLYKPQEAVTRQAMSAFMHRLSNEFEVVTETFDFSATASWQVTVTCPPTKRVLAGGGRTNTTEAFITDSAPNSGNGWVIRWESDNDILRTGGGTAFALCAPSP